MPESRRQRASSSLSSSSDGSNASSSLKRGTSGEKSTETNSTKKRKQTSVRQLFEAQNGRPVTKGTMVYTLKNMPAFPGSDLDIKPAPEPSFSSPGGQRVAVSRPRRALQSNVKKLVVRNATAAAPPAQPGAGGPGASGGAEGYFEQTSAKLMGAVAAILTQRPTELSLEELYRGVENICRTGMAAELWTRCLNQLSSHMYYTIVPQLQAVVKQKTSTTSPVYILREVESKWKTWELNITLIRNIFFYLDRSYLLPGPKRRPIWDTGVILFSKAVINGPTLNTEIFNALSYAVDQWRSTGQDSSTLGSLFLILRNHEPDRERAMELIVDGAGKYAHANVGSEPSDIEAYLSELKSRREIERSIFSRLGLRSAAADSAIKSIDSAMINEETAREVLPRLRVLVSKGLLDLGKLLYEAVQNAKLRPRFAIAWKESIDHATKVMTEGPEDTIPQLIAHYAAHKVFVEEVFEMSRPLNTQLQQQMRAHLSDRGWGPAVLEPFAKYVDRLMRVGLEPVAGIDGGPADLATALRSCLYLFKHAESKDVFSGYYQRDLAKRLIQNKSLSLDNEQQMLDLLREECGASFTQKLQTMFTDMSSSTTLQEQFAEKLNGGAATKKSRALQLKPVVLTHGSWPKFPDMSLTVPNEMAKLRKQFEKFYLEQKSGRRLSWLHTLGNCIIKARFVNGDKELSTTEVQASVLLLFNTIEDGGTLSYGAIRDQLGVKSEDDLHLLRAVQSLYMGKIKLLIKNPTCKSVDTSDLFHVNVHLKEKATRLKINQIRMRSDPTQIEEERREVMEEVALDRHMEIQAALVRIMKARQKLSHAELVNEVITHTKDRGVVDLQDVKKNIESLLEREFLLRDGTDSYVYN